MEQWKPIQGYETYYEVSSLGRVRSLDRQDNMGRWWIGRIRRLKIHKGTSMITLSKNGAEKTFMVRRLIWEAFNSMIPDDHVIMLIDSTKLEILDNLICLPHYRQGDPLVEYMQSEGSHDDELVRRAMAMRSEGHSYGEIAKALGVHKSTVKTWFGIGQKTRISRVDRLTEI